MSLANSDALYRVMKVASVSELGHVLSQVALLVSVAFWTWLWGPLGLLLATPLTVCVVVLGKHVPGLLQSALPEIARLGSVFAGKTGALRPLPGPLLARSFIGLAAVTAWGLEEFRTRAARFELHIGAERAADGDLALAPRAGQHALELGRERGGVRGDPLRCRHLLAEDLGRALSEAGGELRVAGVGPAEPDNWAAHQGAFASHYDHARITRVTDPDLMGNLEVPVIHYTGGETKPSIDGLLASGDLQVRRHEHDHALGSSAP